MPGPHDSLAKLALLDLGHAAGLLRSMLPNAVSKLIDWSTLARDSTHLGDTDYTNLYADLLYCAKLLGRERHVYLLLEHQSSSRAKGAMPLRLLQLMVRIWERDRDAAGGPVRLPAIVPIVLHHGDGGWHGPTAMSDMLDLDADAEHVLGPYLPLFCFVLDDISQMNDAALRAHSAATALGRVMLMAMRYGGSYEELVGAVARYKDVFRDLIAAPDGERALNIVVGYAHEVTQRSPSEIMGDFRAALAGAVEEDVLATGWDQLMEEGGSRELRKVLLRLLAVRFGPVDETVKDRIAGANLDLLERWTDRVVTAATLDDVFAA